MFEESSNSVFRNQASIYNGAFLWTHLTASVCDGAFLWIDLTAHNFFNKSSISSLYIGLQKY